MPRCTGFVGGAEPETGGEHNQEGGGEDSCDWGRRRRTQGGGRGLSERTLPAPCVPRSGAAVGAESFIASAIVRSALMYSQVEGRQVAARGAAIYRQEPLDRRELDIAREQSRTGMHSATRAHGTDVCGMRSASWTFHVRSHAILRFECARGAAAESTTMNRLISECRQMRITDAPGEIQLYRPRHSLAGNHQT
ncbi:hypothetical protein BC628DRAFT_84099 [Trametes gibbosa]|nr:hypothetical protein BC628DRAFT_84099 [Trametes gibbosa]